MSAEAIMTLTAGDPVTASNYNLSTGYGTTGTIGYCYGCATWPCHCHQTYQYITTTAYTIPDKTRAAFAVAKKLLKSKFIKAEKIQEFVELVEMIEKEL